MHRQATFATQQIVFAAFASAYLLKVLRAPFVAMIEPEHQSRILALVNRVIKTLASPEVAVDDHHTPKLYSRFLDGLLKRNQEAAVNSRAPAEPSVLAPLPTIDTVLARATAPASEKRPMSPTIQVQAPDEELPTARPTSLMEAVQGNQPHLFDGEPMYRDDTYAYSTTASSTIDAQTRDTATQYSNEDVLMQGDEDWIATMRALDNPAFWTNGCFLDSNGQALPKEPGSSRSLPIITTPPIYPNTSLRSNRCLLPSCTP